MGDEARPFMEPVALQLLCEQESTHRIALEAQALTGTACLAAANRRASGTTTHSGSGSGSAGGGTTAQSMACGTSRPPRHLASRGASRKLRGGGSVAPNTAGDRRSFPVAVARSRVVRDEMHAAGVMSPDLAQQALHEQTPGELVEAAVLVRARDAAHTRAAPWQLRERKRQEEEEGHWNATTPRGTRRGVSHFRPSHIPLLVPPCRNDKRAGWGIAARRPPVLLPPSRPPGCEHAAIPWAPPPAHRPLLPSVLAREGSTDSTGALRTPSAPQPRAELPFLLLQNFQRRCSESTAALPASAFSGAVTDAPLCLREAPVGGDAGEASTSAGPRRPGDDAARLAEFMVRVEARVDAFERATQSTDLHEFLSDAQRSSSSGSARATVGEMTMGSNFRDHFSCSSEPGAHHCADGGKRELCSRAACCSCLNEQLTTEAQPLKVPVASQSARTSGTRPLYPPKLPMLRRAAAQPSQWMSVSLGEVLGSQRSRLSSRAKAAAAVHGQRDAHSILKEIQCFP